MERLATRRAALPWWLDYGAMEVVRTSDSRRFRVEDVTPLCVRGPVDLDAVDRWVAEQRSADG
jgi:hypothetical protein